jgi:hypothetical protein
MYIDESGDTTPLSQGGKQFLILTGCIIQENDIQGIEQQFRLIKYRYYQNHNIEIKSNFLRYANPDLSQSSILKLKLRSKYNNLEAEITEFLKQIKVTLYCTVIHKESYWQNYPAQNPYHIAYVFLLERFQMYLNTKKSLGICIIDPREGQTEKHFMGNELSGLHEKMRHESNNLSIKCPNIVEKLLFSQSDQTVGIQIADLYCYPVFNVFEYNKGPNDYWRYTELSYPKIFKKNGRVDGYGLKFFPDNTKKDLKFFL